ncbi:unnamed protein product [Didymodactylos carnosus]|uniref:Uncharacterized protein n=1 Tax=Didymodactylos carnosus TaxID=1234261 RepID=A0A814QXG0_9BILA|nr:unnamed protein product [Didymodactylos carnosus]CAF1132954.1 unnamed protein product [Didymodactylos carnosus]CAF3889327.1 unnamed protein product [Didymodactylos carnosus]CAF3918318.1 unnamed protein product [Didymodactylos carnosus]
MDNDVDWILVENEDELIVVPKITSDFEKASEEDSYLKNKLSYATALLKNVQPIHHQPLPVSLIMPRKEKNVSKLHDERKSMALSLEPKPGSQYRNPRDKAGKNKVHQGRRCPSPAPKNLGNSLKIGCTFCNTKLSNRVEHKREARQQRSKSYWKDYDY